MAAPAYCYLGDGPGPTAPPAAARPAVGIQPIPNAGQVDVGGLCRGHRVVLLGLVLGIAASSQVRAAPYTPPLVAPAPAASAAVSSAEWPATLCELAATWEQDWSQTVAVLAVFLRRWPTYGPPRTSRTPRWSQTPMHIFSAAR